MAAGCAGSSETRQDGRSALRVGQFSPITRLNPVLPENGFSSEAHYLVFDKLVARDAKGKPRGGLLDSWRFSDDGGRLILTLRKGVRFHDGTPVTADDLIFTLAAVRDP